MNGDQYKAFVTNLQEQLSCFQEMESLNNHQETLLAQGRDVDPDNLFEFVGTKQNLMSRIEELSQTLTPQKMLWQDTRDGLPEKLREFAQKLLDSTSETIERLLSMESQAQATLEQLMANAQGALENIQQKSRVNQAYHAYGSKRRNPRFVDHRLLIEAHMSGEAFPQPADDSPIDVQSPEAFLALMSEYDRMIERMNQSQAVLRQTVESLKAEIEHKNRLLERKERLAALGEMAAGVAHEIRNPLGGISLYLELLAGDVADNSGAVELCTKIQSAVSRLNHTVESILGFTRPLAPQLAAIDTNRFLDEVLGIAARDIEDKGLRVTLSVEANEREFVGDAQLLHQLMLNLVRNACQASNDGDRIKVDVVGEGEWTCVQVRDFGEGIPEASLPKLFTPFFTTRKGGTGLGLAYCQRIAESHEGQLRADNAEGGGACFTLLLPKRASAPKAPLIAD